VRRAVVALDIAPLIYSHPWWHWPLVHPMRRGRPAVGWRQSADPSQRRPHDNIRLREDRWRNCTIARAVVYARDAIKWLPYPLQGVSVPDLGSPARAEVQ